MASLEGRVGRLVNLHLRACGFEEGQRKADVYYYKTMRWLEEQLEELQGVKGGGK